MRAYCALCEAPNARAPARDADELVDVIAERVVERLLETSSTQLDAWLTAGELARRLNVRRSWVYEHADELGGRRLGSGPKATLRFDWAEVKARTAREDSETSAARLGTPVRRRQQRRAAPSTRQGSPLLPIRGESAA